MDERQIDLSKYRLQEAEDTLKVADRCFQDGFYKEFHQSFVLFSVLLY